MLWARYPCTPRRVYPEATLSRSGPARVCPEAGLSKGFGLPVFEDGRDKGLVVDVAALWKDHHVSAHQGGEGGERGLHGLHSV